MTDSTRSSSRPKEGQGDPTPYASEERVLAALRDGPPVETPAHLAWVAVHEELTAEVGAKAAEEVYDAVWEFLVAVENGETRRARFLRDGVLCELAAGDVAEDPMEGYFDALDALEDERAEVGRRQRAAAAVAVAMAGPPLSDRLDELEREVAKLKTFCGRVLAALSAGL